MSTSPEQPLSRRARVAASLAEQITTGALRQGEQLDGEVRLAERFSVSRGTIRQALGDLQRRNLIATQPGVGSFVTFDGVPLDQAAGWARALADGSTAVTTEVLSIVRMRRDEIPLLPETVELEEGIAVRRLRRAAHGPAVSFECATVPATGALADLPRTGLRDGSLTRTLREAGLVAHHGTQDVSVAGLADREAAILEAEPGKAFIVSVRTSYAADERLVEHVVSHLDPAHFRLHVDFGPPA